MPPFAVTPLSLMRSTEDSADGVPVPEDSGLSLGFVIRRTTGRGKCDSDNEHRPRLQPLLHDSIPLRDTPQIPGAISKAAATTKEYHSSTYSKGAFGTAIRLACRNHCNCKES